MRSFAIFLIIIGLAAGAFPQQAKAEFYDGNRLYARCTTEKGEVTFYQYQAACMGYIAGVADATGTFRAAKGNAQCVPPNVTMQQITDVVVSYLRSNPGERHYAASTLVMLAIGKTWPCGSE
ncbi:Rap1a/Tai family immunity protein [Sphingomonas sp.]|uniref:Rap1a/Tai family immunity protein n=1 Tax=Sphingomonas sp. TaxID=28214 RepID=UPI003BAC9D14